MNKSVQELAGCEGGGQAPTPTLVFNPVTAAPRLPLKELMDVPVASAFDRQERVKEWEVEGHFIPAPLPVRVKNWVTILAVFSRFDVIDKVKRVRELEAQLVSLNAEKAEAEASGELSGERVAQLEQEFHQVDQEKKEVKETLPAFIFGGTMDGKKRADANTRQSMFHTVDVDHLDVDPREVWRKTAQYAKAAGIVFAYVSPSGRGLKIVFLRKWDDIASDQRRVYRELHLEEYAPKKLDKKCKDPSRCSFAATEADILYFDPVLAATAPAPLAPTPATALSEAGVSAFPALSPTTSSVGASAAGDEAAPTEVEGVPLADVARQLVKNICGAEVPPNGNRNNTLYETACALRYALDFRPAWIAPLLPECGLSSGEISGISASACRAERSKGDKASLRKAIDALKTAAPSATPERPEWDMDVPRPVLPPGLQEIIDSTPPQLRDVAFLSMLPCLGTLGTGIRAYSARSKKGDEGELQLPITFFIGEAPMAGSKRKLQRIYTLLTEPLKKQDKENLAKEREYKKEVARKKNAKDIPPPPEVVRRLIPVTISKTELYRRLSAAGGKILLKHTEEMSEVTGFRGRGDWADPTADDKKAFDSAEGGSDFAQQDAHNEPVDIRYNIFYLTTPGERRKYFRGREEDGTVSRYIFATVPYTIGERETHCKELSPEAERKLHELQEELMGIGGDEGAKLYDLGFLDKEREKWAARMGDLAKATDGRPADLALDTFRKRSAVIGFRCAMVIAVCWNAEGKWTKKMIKYIKQTFRFVAQLTLRGQMERYGDSVREEWKKNTRGALSPLPYAGVLKVLPQAFSTADLAEAAKKAGYNLSAGLSAGKIAYKWVTAGAVKRTGHGKYEKVASQNPNAA